MQEKPIETLKVVKTDTRRDNHKGKTKEIDK